MDKTTFPTQIAVKLTVLSGKLRGRTINMSRSEFRLGAAEDCDLRFEDDPGVEPHHAELVEENCEVYLRRASPGARLAVNQREIDEIIPLDKDLIGLGLSGPRIRLRLPPDKFLHCKPPCCGTLGGRRNGPADHSKWI